MEGVEDGVRRGKRQLRVTYQGGAEDTNWRGRRQLRVTEEEPEPIMATRTCGQRRGTSRTVARAEDGDVQLLVTEGEPRKAAGGVGGSGEGGARAEDDTAQDQLALDPCLLELVRLVRP